MLPALKPPDESELGATLIAPDLPAGEPRSASVAPPAASAVPSATDRGRARIAGRYEVLGLLGVGGMGSVYKAKDLELDELVALKVLRRDLLATPGMLERFRREVKLARRVTHPSVARTFDIGEHEGDKYLTMELIDGESRAVLLARETALYLARVVDTPARARAAAAAAHAAGVVHRDLKPDNVMVTATGRVVITDFGIARAHLEDGAHKTQGAISGTPAYMAPEQVEVGGRIDARTDVYALGAMLFEMITGERAWLGESPIAVAAARLVHPPPDPRQRKRRVADGVAALTMRCMARDASQRPVSADAVANELALLLEHVRAGAAEPKGSAAVTTASSPMAAALTPPRPLTSPSTFLASLAAGKTVAVLPFRNGGAPVDDYLADGLTDDLIDNLSMTRGLRVCSRGVVLRFKGEVRDPREIGRELDVQVVVEGSVRRAGDAVRVSARLSSVADGFQLWAKRFDRPAADLLVVSDEVARAVADALTVDLVAPARAAPEDPVAVDLYLRGRQEYRRYWRESAAAAVELFQQALARAPDDPTILAACAMAAARLWFFGGEGAEEAGGLARRMSERAVTVAPGHGEARLALAMVRFHEADSIGALRETRQALAIAPANAEAHGLLGRILLELGPVVEARRRSETALSLDPFIGLVYGDLARGHALLGEWAEVDALVERGANIDPQAAWFIRSRLTLWRGDRELVERYLRSAGGSSPTTQVIAASMLSVVTGKERVFDVPVLNLLAGRGLGARHVIFFRQMAAELASSGGQLEDATQMVTEAVDAGLLDVVWMDRCPLLEPLRRDPAFAPLRATVAARAARVLEAFGGVP